MIANLWGKGGRKKRILGYVLASTICLAPLSVPLMAQPTWGQTQNSQAEEAQRLANQATQQERQGKLTQAITTWQQTLVIVRQLKDRINEASILNNIAGVYDTIGQRQIALKYYNQALPICQQIGDRAGEANTLTNIGFVYHAIGEPQTALKYYKQALPIRQQVGDRLGEARTLNNIGGVYNTIGQPQAALKYYNQALPIRQQVGDRTGQAVTLTNIGGIYDAIGQPQAALKYYNQALPILQEVGDRAKEAAILTNIGGVYNEIGQPQGALKYYNQALPILQQAGERTAEAATLNNIGRVYHVIGQPQTALKYYDQALLIRQQVGDRLGEAGTLNNIGGVYYTIGQPQAALKYYNQALPIIQQVGDRAGEASILNNIGGVYYVIGQPQIALSYYKQALLIFQQVGDRSGQGTTLNNIGEIYSVIGQSHEALNYFDKALPIRQQVGDRAGEATTLNNIGEVYYTIGKQKQALKYYNQALSILRLVHNRAGEAATLNNIGVVYRDVKQTKEAIDHYQKSLEISLEIRSNLKRENRQSFYGEYEGRAIALTDLLIDQNQPDKAYEWINRVATAELADYTRLVNAKVANPEAQKAIDEWNQKNAQLQFLYSQLQEKFSEERSRQMRELEKQVFKQAEEIARQFPEAAELFETKPEDIAKLRASIPPDTVVVHPVLLTDVKNVPNSIAIFVLTKDKLTVTKKPLDPKVFNQLLQDYLTQIEDRKNINYLDTSAKLYDILIRPVADQIQAASPKQLSIIATGKLRYLPFETLRESQSNKYLLEKYPINYLTRISTTSLSTAAPHFPPLQNILATVIITSLAIFTWRKFGIVPSGGLVIVLGGLAFFFFSGRNAQVLALGNPLPTQQNLAGAEAEARSIGKIFTGSEVYIGNEATLEVFKNQAPKFSFLHLGTHGCFQLGGCPKLQMEANTLLFANQQQFNIADAALLGLKNTELLTLSACQTAKEANANGEEIAGLAYIFERAGAKAVMASLWNADDNTTKDIMEQFYTNIKKGMSKGKALQQAKLKHIARQPFFWSTLVLIGDAQ